MKRFTPPIAHLVRLGACASLVAMASGAWADSLDDLRASLNKLQGSSSVRATVSAKVKATVKEDSEKPRIENGVATVAVEDGPQGLRLSYTPELLAKLQLENSQRQRDSKAATPTRTAMGELNYGDVLNMTQAAGNLLRRLEGAKLVSERNDTWNGTPAKLLSLELQVDKNQKYVKSQSSTMEVWIDAEGRPLASKAKTEVSGRAFVMISFEMKASEDKVYSVVGDRLIVTRRESSESASGMGQGGDNQATVTLKMST